MKTCQYCNSKNKDSSNFCENCGAKLLESIEDIKTDKELFTSSSSGENTPDQKEAEKVINHIYKSFSKNFCTELVFKSFFALILSFFSLTGFPFISTISTIFSFITLIQSAKAIKSHIKIVSIALIISSIALFISISSIITNIVLDRFVKLF